MKNIVFTSYAFGPLYVYQQERLRQSILKIYPDANIRFWHNDDPSSQAPCNVPGARTFHESMYGFKVHCVRNCMLEGFDIVIFLDAAMVLEKPIDDVLLHAEEIGMLATDEKTKLSTVLRDDIYNLLGVEKSYAKKLHLVGGSIYIFDFRHVNGRDIYKIWSDLESHGMFGSEDDAQQPWWNGHRCDEACMSLAMSYCGVEPQSFDVVGYHNLGGGNANRVFTFCKLHFKGLGEVCGHTICQALIPPHGTILDAGCRGFQFADFFRRDEYDVYPIDIDEIEGENYHRIALCSKSGMRYIKRDRDPDATRTSFNPEDGEPVNAMTLEAYSEYVGVNHWDLIKLDIEGDEYDLLKNAHHPIAGQITVEFHAHLGQTKSDLDELLEMLSEYYHIQNKIWREWHGGVSNYWDVLLISKTEAYHG